MSMKFTINEARDSIQFLEHRLKIDWLETVFVFSRFLPDGIGGGTTYRRNMSQFMFRLRVADQMIPSGFAQMLGSMDPLVLREAMTIAYREFEVAEKMRQQGVPKVQ